MTAKKWTTFIMYNLVIAIVFTIIRNNFLNQSSVICKSKTIYRYLTN